jgi:hypothetical protein
MLILLKTGSVVELEFPSFFIPGSQSFVVVFGGGREDLKL